VNRELGITQTESLLASADDALRAADPSAFTVLPRVLRRVIRHELDLPGLLARIPHRESYVVAADRLRQIVSPDELSRGGSTAAGDVVILLARPEEGELGSLTEGDLLRRYWRLLFHARVHAALIERTAAGRLTAALIRERIDQIGQVAFDEIDAVLRQEGLLLAPGDRRTTYVEFCAVYLELRYFRPALLPIYFPSLRDPARIDSILQNDVDAAGLYHSTRLMGAADPSAVDAPENAPAELSAAASAGIEPGASPRRAGDAVRESLLRRAERAAQRGNQVRSAIVRWRAAQQSSPEHAEALTLGAFDELARLGERLTAALGLDPARVEGWQASLRALLPRSAVGYWNANARLLYDLQKVCLAFERETYVVDLLTWLRTFGRRPLRRPLPYQRAVLMSRHLRTAASRLNKAELPQAERERLRDLLREAMSAAEARLRGRLRPLIQGLFEEVDLRAANAPERIALRKIVEELLDSIVERGFLTMGDLRDAVSRSNLKLSDLSGPAEMWRGDPLLRADRGLSHILDGVYQRGPFYLRWLQGLSSLAFGTEFGRAVVLYTILPFGGAYVILAALEHLSHVVRGHEPEHATSFGPPDWQTAVLRAGTVICVGILLLGVMHVPWFRAAVLGGLRRVGRVLRWVFLDVPHWLYSLNLVHEVMRSAPVTIFRRHLLNPLVLTLLFCWALPALRVYGPPTGTVWAAVWLGLTVILNSRAGRDIEEVAAERLERTWHRIRIHFFVALFDLIMDTFKRVLELVEKILYGVDEWLRFRSGESTLVLAAKAGLGVAWAAATFVIRFCVTLLVEPQVNPIKHFPVVTVSHKLILPFSVPLTGLLEPVMGKVMAGTVAGTIVLLLPGVFGFLVWELRGNWRLYEANRHETLKPVAVGWHGETMIRLLKPGLHSGTVPKLFNKLRRVARQADSLHRQQAQRRLDEKLHHVALGLDRFFERDLLPLFELSPSWKGIDVVLGRIELGTNSVRVELVRRDAPDSPAWFTFAEQTGWLVAGSIEPGWMAQLSAPARDVLKSAIVGLYQMAGVDLVREQIENCFAPRVPPYDVAEDGIVVWPGGRYAVEARYDLAEHPRIHPQPQAVADGFRLPALEAERLIFRVWPVLWDDWVATWEFDRNGRYAGKPLLPMVCVLR